MPTQHFNYNHLGQLQAEGVTLESIAQEHGTPVYVYSAKAITEQYKKFSRGLAGIDHQICYAVKANSNIAILKILGDLGCGMDIVSAGELFRTQRAGIDPGKIVFSGVGKTPEELHTALLAGPTQRGIHSFNVESVAELKLLSQIASSLKKVACVSLRYNPDVDAKTHPYISTGLKKNKFGLNKSEVVTVIKDHKSFSNIVFQGLSIHIGSQITSLRPLADSFKKLLELAKWVDSTLPQPLQTLDLGGGMGIVYKNEKPFSPEQYCKLVQKTFKKLAYKIIIEPGRILTGNSGVLVSQVLYTKPRGKKEFLIVDSGMNDLLRPALYGSHHEILPTTKSTAKRKEISLTSVVGPVCESADCFANDRKLSKKLLPGDYVAILSAGAYGFSMASTYNSRPKPAEVLISQGKFRVIRARETLEDLVRGETT